MISPQLMCSMFLGTLLLSGCATPSQIIADAEINRLCAIDGGVKVYETVKLPPEKFNEWGLVNFYNPAQSESALGAAYIYKWDIQYFAKGQPTVNGPQELSIRRDHIKIIRKEDIKLIGEVVMYHRAGGDIPGPWMPSSYRCPTASEANEIVLMNNVFIKSINEQ